VKAGRGYNLKFKYANVAGDVARYSIYDLTNSAYIVSPVDLANSVAWSSEQTFSITAPAGCKQIRYALRAKTATDQVYFHDVQFVDKANSLSGSWLSPVQDLTSSATRRYWGDFITSFVASNTTWSGVFGGNAWNVISNFTTKRWYELFQPTSAAQLDSTVYWGTALSGDGSIISPSQAKWFQLLAPEFTARYVQVSVNLQDPVLDAKLYLKKLNMKSYYWS
jgi:hypothetical protein